MNETPAPLKIEIPVDGYLLFQKNRIDNKLTEVLRTVDIINVTNRADDLCRTYPGTEFIVYSGITGKWYSYYKPAND
jgi:hypothetical protein